MKLIFGLFALIILASVTITTAILPARLDGKLRAYNTKERLSLATVEKLGQTVNPDINYKLEMTLKKRFVKTGLFTYRVETDTLTQSIRGYSQD